MKKKDIVVGKVVRSAHQGSVGSLYYVVVGVDADGSVELALCCPPVIPKEQHPLFGHDIYDPAVLQLGHVGIAKLRCGLDFTFKPMRKYPQMLAPAYDTFEQYRAAWAAEEMHHANYRDCCGSPPHRY